MPPLLIPAAISRTDFLSLGDSLFSSKVSPDSGVFPVELVGEDPSLSRLLNSPDLRSEPAMDQGRGLGAVGGAGFIFDADTGEKQKS